MMILRPEFTVVVFGETDESIKPLVDSIEQLDMSIKQRMEFTYVVFNKHMSKENEKLVFSLRRFMNVRFLDYSEQYKKDKPEVYCLSKRAVIKTPGDTLNEIEAKCYLEGKDYIPPSNIDYSEYSY